MFKYLQAHLKRPSLACKPPQNITKSLNWHAQNSAVEGRRVLDNGVFMKGVQMWHCCEFRSHHNGWRADQGAHPISIQRQNGLQSISNVPNAKSKSNMLLLGNRVESLAHYEAPLFVKDNVSVISIYSNGSGLIYNYENLKMDTCRPLASK